MSRQPEILVDSFGAFPGTAALSQPFTTSPAHTTFSPKKPENITHESPPSTSQSPSQKSQPSHKGSPPQTALPPSKKGKERQVDYSDDKSNEGNSPTNDRNDDIQPSLDHQPTTQGYPSRHSKANEENLKSPHQRICTMSLQPSGTSQVTAISSTVQANLSS
ncbi:hypothetical protein PtA15_14A394 [Puccinia triticina]|uniref:Uncharacterized protein n=1 Tax=Puccinia triticina TaxID=208348 RepID=A0ABY7D2Q2_9BASI|nr:uncharacterized protein PtA15_14A394 [Puccinia triticina]WAQ91510.1 hypothetical protein PtA15_14A394 [Puccinia triticina]